MVSDGRIKRRINLLPQNVYAILSIVTLLFGMLFLLLNKYETLLIFNISLDVRATFIIFAISISFIRLMYDFNNRYYLIVNIFSFLVLSSLPIGLYLIHLNNSMAIDKLLLFYVFVNLCLDCIVNSDQIYRAMDVLIKTFARKISLNVDEREDEARSFFLGFFVVLSFLAIIYISWDNLVSFNYLYDHIVIFFILLGVQWMMLMDSRKSEAIFIFYLSYVFLFVILSPNTADVTIMP